MSLAEKKMVFDTAAMFAVASGIDVQSLNLDTIAENAIGTTSGGVEVSAKPVIREVEFDGKNDRKVAEMERVTGWEVSASAEALEFIESNLTLSLFSKEVGTKFTEFKPKVGILTATDYKDLLIVGTLSDGKNAVGLIRNTFNEEGLSFKTEDNDEAKIKMTFNGRYKLEEDIEPFAFYVGV